ncbi:MAG TPA: hypothetical protein VNJ02_15480 [Vicinamibacterales bacterium]|nr:hypothetical protein [Vicinamibacterales bacterium]
MAREIVDFSRGEMMAARKIAHHPLSVRALLVNQPLKGGAVQRGTGSDFSDPVVD